MQLEEKGRELFWSLSEGEKVAVGGMGVCGGES